MFQYEYPHGPFYTTTKVDKNGSISFDPPVFEQRYSATLQILNDSRWAKDMKKIAEFGCADMKLLRLLRRNVHVEHILQIDINRWVLKTNSSRADPLLSDYLRQRERPLRTDLLVGSIAHLDESLQNVDAVIALELIEHVYDDVLNAIPKNIFGFMKPKLVILSTPNVEFNVLFGQLKENGMRHLDHKFEWTRAEFQAWCLQITKDYPNYKVAFKGVGAPPAGKETLGFVSQIGIFVRNDVIDLPLVPDEDTAPPMEIDEATKYSLVHTSNYPQRVDNRTEREKLIDEIHYCLFRCQLTPHYLCEKEDLYKVPISEVVLHTERFGGTEPLVRELLEDMPEFLVEDDTVLIVNDSGSNFNSSDDELNLFDGDLFSDSERHLIGEDEDILESQLVWD